MAEPAGRVIIVDDAGNRHIFPAGMDPKRAAAVVRQQSAREPGFDVERPDPNAAPLSERLAARVAETNAADARTQGNERMGDYAAETIRNIPRDIGQQAGGVFDLLKTAAGATAELGTDIGSTVRDAIGLDPHYQTGRPNQAALRQIPGLVAQHYADYLDPDKRAEMVREHPAGLALDVAGAVGAARGATGLARRATPGVVAAVKSPGGRIAAEMALAKATGGTGGLLRSVARKGLSLVGRGGKTEPPAGRLTDPRVPTTVADELAARLDDEAGAPPASDLPPDGLSPEAIESRIAEANAHADAGIERQRLNKEQRAADLAPQPQPLPQPPRTNTGMTPGPTPTGDPTEAMMQELAARMPPPGPPAPAPATTGTPMAGSTPPPGFDPVSAFLRQAEGRAASLPKPAPKPPAPVPVSPMAAKMGQPIQPAASHTVPTQPPPAPPPPQAPVAPAGEAPIDWSRTAALPIKKPGKGIILGGEDQPFLNRSLRDLARGKHPEQPATVEEQLLKMEEIARALDQRENITSNIPKKSRKPR